MESTPFPPHGGTSVELRGRTIVFRSGGDLNEEEIQRLLAELGPMMPRLAHRPWAILGVARKVVMLTREAEKASRAAVPPMVKLGLSGFAVAILEEKGRPMMESQVERVVGEDCPLKFFDTEDEAQAWLGSIVG